MEIAALILIAASPYTTYVPILYMIYKLIAQKNTIKINFMSSYNISVLIIFLWALFAGLINRDLLSVATSFVLLLYLAISLYCEVNYTTNQRIEHLIRNLVYISFFAAFLGIVEKILSTQMNMNWWSDLYWNATYVSKEESYRIFSTFANPNTAGTWFAIMALACIYLYSRAAGKQQRNIYIVGLSGLIVALILTGSYGAIFGFQLGLWAYYFFMQKKSRNMPILLLLLSAVSLLYIYLQANHPINSRSEIWAKCIDMFEQKPVTGWGLLGLYKYTQLPHAHNTYINVAATLGVIGLFLYFFMKYTIAKNLFSLYKDSIPLTPLLAAVQTVIIGQGLVDFTILTPQAGILFFGCSAFINSLASKRQTLPLYATGRLKSNRKAL